jgi:hypothetical protein
MKASSGGYPSFRDIIFTVILVAGASTALHAQDYTSLYWDEDAASPPYYLESGTYLDGDDPTAPTNYFNE